MSDAAYELTRRKGQRATVVRLLSSSANEETGERDPIFETRNYRWVVAEPAPVRRVSSPNRAAMDVWESTFLFYARDVNFVELNAEDYVEFGGRKFQVVTSAVEDSTIVVRTRSVMEVSE